MKKIFKLALKKILKWALMLGVFPIAILIWIIRPFYRIQLVKIPCTAIGHFAGNVDTFLVDQVAHPRKRTRYIFYYPLNSKPINQQLHVMWARVLPILTSLWATRVIVAIELLCSETPFLKAIFYDITGTTNLFDPGDMDKTGKMLDLPPFLEFTQNEVIQGEAALREMGIPEGAKYIVMHSRDVAFLASQYFRNTEIGSFFKGAKYFFDKGYYVVRTGARVSNPIPDSEHYIIDYASKFRTAFLDLYLSANCAFYFGDSCGFFGLSTCFRKPLAITNQSPLLNGPYFYRDAVLLPKKYWLMTEKRYMSLSEIIFTNSGFLYGEENYVSRGIEVHSNTPEEILAYAVEIEARFNGTYSEMEEESIQGIFKNKVSKVDFLMKTNGDVRCKLSSSFVKMNPFFLQDASSHANIERQI